jgi:hypothetical protein
MWFLAPFCSVVPAAQLFAGRRVTLALTADRSVPFTRRPDRELEPVQSAVELIKPLSFVELFRPDEEGEGVLLTELVCQSDWGPTHMPPQPGVH